MTLSFKLANFKISFAMRARVGVGVFLLFFSLITISYAEIITVQPNTIIDKNTNYKHVILDFSQGNFIVKNNATLTIENSQIIGHISPVNPFIINLESGKLFFNHNQVSMNADIPKQENLPALYYFFRIFKGIANINFNNFTLNQLFTVGLLTTLANSEGSIHFTHNQVQQFHGGLLINNIAEIKVIENEFKRVSSSNVFIIGSSGTEITGNRFLFSGNGNVGDAIDLFYVSHGTIKQNYIVSGSCYGIFILDSQHILLTENHISSGITYGLFLANGQESINDFNQKILNQVIDRKQLAGYTHAKTANAAITLSKNYFILNRYGMAGRTINGLTVKDCIFIQRFEDDLSRTFWTNNDNLLLNVTDLVWENNFYKEAFTQYIGGSNSKSYKFIVFPAHGGVVMN